jgi:hypothetical protein
LTGVYDPGTVDPSLAREARMISATCLPHATPTSIDFPLPRMSSRFSARCARKSGSASGKNADSAWYAAPDAAASAETPVGARSVTMYGANSRSTPLTAS